MSNEQQHHNGKAHQAAHNTAKMARKIGDKALNSNSLIFTFLRSIVSSQAASWVDLGLGFILFAFVKLTPWLSTAIGAVAGGVVNCMINYKFTFHAKDVTWRAVIVKYALIWLGSITLNSLGTQLLYSLIDGWQWLIDIGFRPDGFYATARLIVSLLVSWFWNFLMQRYFVYRPTRFDAHAERFTELFYKRHN